MHGDLEPGSPVVEEQIASSLSVSRTPVREALHRLEYDGLVHTVHGFSPRVSGVTIADIEEVYPIVMALEGLAAYLATPRLTQTDLRRMEELTRAMARHGRRGEIEHLVAADTEFHGLLHRRSQNSRLRRIVRGLRSQMERFEYLFFSFPAQVRASVVRHRRLVRILRRKDPRAAQRALMAQWDEGRRALIVIVGERGEESCRAPYRPAAGKTRRARRGARR